MEYVAEMIREYLLGKTCDIGQVSLSPVLGDSHCFFRCIASILGNTYSQVRADHINHLQAHYLFSSETEMREYFTTHSAPNASAWADECTITLTAAVYNYRIIVFHSLHGTIGSAPCNPADLTVYLVNWNNVHFDLLHIDSIEFQYHDIWKDPAPELVDLTNPDVFPLPFSEWLASTQETKNKLRCTFVGYIVFSQSESGYIVYFLISLLKRNDE